MFSRAAVNAPDERTLDVRLFGRARIAGGGLSSRLSIRGKRRFVTLGFFITAY